MQNKFLFVLYKHDIIDQLIGQLNLLRFKLISTIMWIVLKIEFNACFVIIACFLIIYHEY